MKTKFLMSISVALAIMASVSGCVNNVVPETNYVEKSIECKAEGGEHYLYVDLNQATEAILSAVNGLDWFSIEDAWMEGSILVIKVVVEGNKTGENRVGQAVVPLKNDTSVRVTVNQSSNYANNQDTLADRNFITNWYKMSDFFLGNDKTQNINTPWTKKQGTVQVPENIYKQNKPEHGWEVVFIDNGWIKDRCYFGLYNRYLGKLRVYAYTNVTALSSQYMVRYQLKNSKYLIKYAYHSLPVAIPIDCAIDTDKPFTGDKQVTFQNITVPYGNLQQQGLVPGWKAFDIDLSAYSPTSKFYTEDVQLDIDFLTSLEAIFHADGTIDGKIVGKFQNSDYASMSNNGGMEGSISDVLGNIGAGSKELSSLFTKNKMLEPGVLGTVFKWGGVMFSAVGAIMGHCEEVTEERPGTIELKTQQKLKITGEIGIKTATNQPGVSLRSEAFVKTQPYDNGNTGNKPYIGEGIWSLATTPNYYIVDDVMLGKEDKVHFEPKEGGDKFYSTITEDENVRMVSFFDPTSVKVNINTNIIKNIDTVEVFASPVAVLNQPFKYTDEYYNLIFNKTIDRNMPICTAHMTYYHNQAFSGDAHRVKYYMKLPVEKTDTLISKDLKIESIYEKDIPYGLRGVVGTCEGIVNKKVISDPEILYKPNGDKTCEGGKIPDILISVVVRVHTKDGQMFVYTHRFLPNIVHIKRADLGDCYTKLSQYASDCKSKKAIDKLSNDNNVSVYHPAGSEYVAHYMKVIRQVINYQYKK